MKNIYTKLLEIIEKNEAFYSVIQEINWYKIESFSYRLANNEMFKQDFEKEMRGIAFIYGNKIKKPKLFTLWFHKFFNYWEWNTISEIKWKEICSIQDKVDGSLVMFWKLPCWKIIAKSKTSITSYVADFANNFIASDKKLYDFVEKSLEKNEFPIFEYIWPENRIVVSYEKDELVLLWIRKINWEYFSAEQFEKIHNENISHIKISKIHKNITFEEVLEKQKQDENYEGFIVNFTDWYKLKIKLQSYVIKHKAKDDIWNIKNLIEICLNEETDDLKTLFIWDKIALKLITDIEKKVFEYHNHIISETEILLNENNKLIKKFNSNILEIEKREIRKEIAIKNKQSKYFSLLMKKLSWKKIDYKEFVRNTISY